VYQADSWSCTQQQNLSEAGGVVVVVLDIPVQEIFLYTYFRQYEMNRRAVSYKIYIMDLSGH
jgi:hypothetical protein